MELGQIVLLVYAILMIGGGMVGARAGSRVSMIAGSGSGLALLVALLWSTWNSGAGYWAGTVIGVVLCVIFGIRLIKTGKAMPAGMLLAISLAAVILLAFAAGRAGGVPPEPAPDPTSAIGALAGSHGGGST